MIRIIRAWNLETDMIENMEIEEEFLLSIEQSEKEEKLRHNAALEADHDLCMYVHEE